MEYKKSAQETFEFLQNMKKEKVDFGDDDDGLFDEMARFIRIAAIQEIQDCLIDTRVQKPSDIQTAGIDIERNGF